MIALGLFGLIAALLVLRQNIIVLLGVAVLYVYLFYGGGIPAGWQLGDWGDLDWLAIQSVVIDVWNAANNEILLSIPLYILAGGIMSRGSIAERLIGIMRAISKPMPGGLAVATILSCAMFAAISGSSAVTLLAVGAIMYPALLKQGYSRSFALGAICAGGTLGIIIPPSIPLILYGVMTQTSIADLFIAGIGPALVLVALFTAYSVIVNYRVGRPAIGPEDGPPAPMKINWPSLEELWVAFRRGIWSLSLPVIILGGIYSGHFTPTESAAVAVLAALVIELLIHREMKPVEVVDVITDTTRLMGSLFPVLALAVSLNTFLVYEQVPQGLVEALKDFFDSTWSFVLATNVLLLIVGFFIDIGSAVLILGPLLQPVAESFGLDPVQFGIMMIVNLEIGYLTPPMGLNLIIAMGAFREDFWTICKSVVPFIGLMIVGLALVILFPALSLFLVS